MKARTNLNILFAVSVLLVGMAPAIASGGTIYVDADASPGGDGSSWATAYKYLQDALYKPPTSGDQIWVAEGTYKPDEDEAANVDPNDRTETFQLINGVVIYGGFAGGESSLDERDWETNVTILSGDLNGDDVGFTNNGENSYHVVTGSGTDATTVLDGFTITAGNANGSNPYDHGGGMYNNGGSPTVTNCIISGNSAYRGGGIYNYSSSDPTVTNCTFSGNSVDYHGGGMFNDQSSPTVTNCAFSGNSARWGGGMDNDECSPVVTNCTFRDNSASQTGGGMHNQYESSPTITNCTFSGNSANDNGGGMYNRYDSSPTLTNCTFSGNSAYYYGGGMYNNSSSPTLTNCILWGNTAPSGPQIYNYGTSSATVSYSDVQGGWAGTGNINADPCFADPYNGDYHLKSQAGRWDPNTESWVRDANTSVAIDAGDPADPIGYEPFPNGGIINMGAYSGTEEASKSYCGDRYSNEAVAADINGDCKVDFFDFAFMALHWLEDNKP